MTALETLKQYWGYDSFRPKQAEIIESALSGRDTLAILPTGGGKSVCFQVPALIREGIAIVITPLIALMKDQVQNLEARGIKAMAVHTGMNRREIDTALNNAAYGDYKFLYVSPERVGTSLFQSYLEVMNVSYIVVDEAHCISQWGYDFRPDYLSIAKIRVICSASVIALTATATEEVAQDIIDKLTRPDAAPSQMKRNRESFVLLKSGFERPNLSYVVRQCEDKFGQLLGICRAISGSGIVYMRSRNKCEEIAALLRAQGESADFYHAGLDPYTRSKRQSEWKQGRTRVMVCTNAFGMGIDKSDVRFVAHLGLPDSPEAYFQEAGRAGRDGKRSYAVLVWNKLDLSRSDQLLELSFPDPEYIEDIYQKLHIFYEIPYEAGKGRTLKFSLEEFAKHYGLSRASLRYALKYLEMSEHLSYSEDVDIDTRVKILVDRDLLYELELGDPKRVELLELIMRSCPGVFSFSLPISESLFADKLGVSVAALRQLLYGLSIEHIIKYIPCDHGTVISLLHNRLMPGNLDLQMDKYNFLKGNARKRLDAMFGYVQDTESCRSRALLRYFGQSESSECGECDVCRRKGLYNRVKALSVGPELLKESVCDPREGLPEDTMELYRKLIDQGDL